MRNFILSTVFLTACLSAYSQAVGEWQAHLSYAESSKVVETPNKLFAIASGSLFSVDKDGTEIEIYSKENGLSDNGIVQIAYNEKNNCLLIAYENANIDLLYDDRLYNIPDFMHKTMPGNKTIYQIHFAGDYAYLATGIGVVVLNMAKVEIKENYTLKKDGVTLPVYGITTTETEVFASTSAGVYYGKLSDNLLDFSKWTLAGFPIGKQIVFFKDNLYLLTTIGIYRFDGASWTRLLESYSASDLTVSGDKLLVTTPTVLYAYTSDTECEEITGLQNAQSAVMLSGKTNTYVIAAKENGLVCIDDGQIQYSGIQPAGPLQNTVYWSQVAGNRLFFINGGIRGSGKTPVMILDIESGAWKNTPTTIAEATGLAVHPDDNTHFFVTSSSSGVFEFRNDELFLQHTYLTSEGVLEPMNLNPNSWLWLTSPVFFQGELWVANGFAPNSIKILKADGTWDKRAYSPISQKEGYRMIVDSNNRKWLLGSSHSGSKGLFVFDDTHYRYFSDRSDGENFSDSDGIIEISVFYAIAEDRTGAIWIGLEKGILVVNNPVDIFNENFRCSRIKVPLGDGSASYLLASERINAIAVDGGNRKWIGTETSGLYLVSPDGLETLHHFTVENSPLFSNRIMSLSIEHSTGLVFVGTDKGLLSYRSDATNGNPSYAEVHVFPNPVRPNYSGLISITGLVENSVVKITDISGNLLYEGISQGGQLSWDGLTGLGARVPTGVYLVFVSTRDGSQNSVTKIMIVR
ncbi:MAG: hypothetical protein LBD45_07570 [Bacteroidales bacterium]|jgi:streptogramin lyase|nr:hypothetical protein [Bacteroidales bacterium]